MKKKPIYCLFKRAFDLLFSLLAVVLLFVPMLAVAIAIKVDSKGPVFFRQDRIGKNKEDLQDPEVPVDVYRHRSQRADAPS